MGLYLRNNRYYYKKQIEGKIYYKALKLKKGQEGLLSARLKQIEDEIIAQHFGLEYQRSDQIYLSEYKEKYISAKQHKKSLSLDIQRLDRIIKILNDPLLSQIKKKNILALDNQLCTMALEKSTVNRYFEILRHVLNLAIEDGYIRENPVKYYKSYVEEGERRALSKDEISRILEAAAQIQARPRSLLQAAFHDMILFALHTGMRLSEILKLKRSYIKDGIIFYPITETKYRRRGGQNSKTKIICLNRTASAIVEEQSGGGEFVFNVEWRDPKSIRRTMARIREATGIADFTFHQLRHTVSTFLSQTVSLSAAKTLLGHADLRTTLRYSHPEIAEQRKAVAKIETHFKSLSPK